MERSNTSLNMNDVLMKDKIVQPASIGSEQAQSERHKTSATMLKSLDFYGKYIPIYLKEMSENRENRARSAETRAEMQ